MRRIAITADDLTGASDTGVQLARRSLHTIVALDPHQLGSLPDCDVLVVDTDSRALTGPEAYATVARAVRAVIAAGYQPAYKKVDSTLRGNIGAELDAVMDEAGFALAALAPAFPATGRTTAGGQHLLHGVPAAETEAAHDPRGGVRDSALLRLLRRQSRREAALVDLATVRAGTDATLAALMILHERRAAILVFDAETDADLETIAVALSRCPQRVLWAGSAGLAAHLPDTLDLPLTVRRSPAFVPVDGPILIVVGTASHITRTQVARLAELPEVTIVAQDPSALVAGRDSARLGAKVTQMLAAGRNTALTLSAETTTNLLPAHIADALGALAASVLRTGLPQGVILTGGDTARAVCRHLQATGIRLLDELAPGVPVGTLTGAPPLLIVTKAGAFGTPSTLVDALRALQGIGAAHEPEAMAGVNEQG
ncbi:MAG: four-carbon acid sugar kinase family protein [Chloroflexota bacterium]|nr:four-carbon acid sugar kinase family protein [Chloroflexota bacterium]